MTYDSSSGEVMYEDNTLMALNDVSGTPTDGTSLRWNDTTQYYVARRPNYLALTVQGRLTNFIGSEVKYPFLTNGTVIDWASSPTPTPAPTVQPLISTVSWNNGTGKFTVDHRNTYKVDVNIALTIQAYTGACVWTVVLWGTPSIGGTLEIISISRTGLSNNFNAHLSSFVTDVTDIYVTLSPSGTVDLVSASNAVCTISILEI